MRHRLVPSLLLAAAMAACRAPAGTDPKPAKSALPSTPATATPAKPTGAAFLKPLPGKAAKLAGQVYVDALYATTAGGATRLQDAAGGVLGAGGAQFIGNAGGTAVAQGGNGLITNDGGSLMAGGQIVAQGGGNVIVPAGLITNDGGSLITNDGGSLITNDGGSLITNDGGSLITNDGGSLITNDGAGIVAQGGGNLARPGGYQLAEAPAGAAPAFGDAWPAAGMWLSVVDQRTGLTVPLGQDAQGKNVYTVYTNAEGKYDVSVDAQVEPYARVVVRAPGRVDRRMVVSGVSASGRVDDDTRAVDAFMRLSIGRLVLGALGVDTGDGLVFASSTSDSELDVVAQLALADLRQKVKDLNIAAYSQAKKLEFGLLLADALLVAVDYRHLTLDGEGVTFISAGGRAAVGKPVQDAVVDLMRQTRLATAAQLKGQADPAAFFGAKKYVIEANLRRKPAEQYQIRRAADIPEFIVREYISVPLEGQSSKAFDVLYDLGLPNDARDILAMAGHTVFGKALKKLVAVAPDGTTLNDGLVKLANLADKRLGKAVLPVPVPDGAPPALPTAPPPAPMEVTLVAGAAGQAAAPGARADGPGLSARFANPRALAVGPDHALYVADFATASVRRLRFDAAGAATVDTVVNDSHFAGFADGPADQAKLDGPTGLAFDAQGRLYVADSKNRAVRRVTFDAAGKGTVATIFGGPTTPAGSPDGPNGAGGLGDCGFLSVAPDGRVVMADLSINALRQLTEGAAGWTVSTLGRRQTAMPTRWEGTLADAGFNNPGGVKFAADGTLWLTDIGGCTVRKIPGPLGPDARTELVAGSRAHLKDESSFWNGAWMDHPAGVALDAQGRAIVADAFTHRVLRVTPDGWVQTLAGGGDAGHTGGGFKDGNGMDARFQLPWDVAVDGDTIYVVEIGNHTIRRLRPKA